MKKEKLVALSIFIINFCNLNHIPHSHLITIPEINCDQMRVKLINNHKKFSIVSKTVKLAYCKLHKQMLDIMPKLWLQRFCSLISKGKQVSVT